MDMFVLPEKGLRSSCEKVGDVVGSESLAVVLCVGVVVSAPSDTEESPHESCAERGAMGCGVEVGTGSGVERGPVVFGVEMGVMFCGGEMGVMFCGGGMGAVVLEVAAGSRIPAGHHRVEGG